MKKIMGIWILCLSTQIFAKSPTILNKIACTNQVLEAIASIGTPVNWIKANEFSVETQLVAGGKLSLYSKGETTKVAVNSKDYNMEFEYKLPKCKLQITRYSAKDEGFSDKDLDQLISINKKGAILLWSPHMSLSVYELLEMQEYLANLNIPIEVLLDTNADKEFSKNILKKYNLPIGYLKRLNSRKLEKFGINIHFPSIVFYKNMKLVQRVPGYNSKVKLKALIKKYLE